MPRTIITTPTTTANSLSNPHVLSSISETHLSGVSAPPQSRQLLGQQAHDHDMMQTAAVSISDPDVPHLSDYSTSVAYKNAETGPTATSSSSTGNNNIPRDSPTASASNPLPVISPRDSEATNKRPHFKANGKRGPLKSGAATGSGSGTPVANKRRCVSNACIACRKRKSKVCLIHFFHLAILFVFLLRLVAYEQSNRDVYYLNH